MSIQDDGFRSWVPYILYTCSRSVTFHTHINVESFVDKIPFEMRMVVLGGVFARVLTFTPRTASKVDLLSQLGFFQGSRHILEIVMVNCELFAVLDKFFDQLIWVFEVLVHDDLRVFRLKDIDVHQGIAKGDMAILNQTCLPVVSDERHLNE